MTMHRVSRRAALLTLPLLSAALGAAGAFAQTPSPGITDTSVLIGITAPVSGPAAALGGVSRGIELRVNALNAAGGVKMADGKTRKIELTILDDAVDPQRALTNARRLVESNKVFALVGTMTTASNQAVAPYADEQKVPNLFLYSAVAEWGNEKLHPWSMSLLISFPTEAAVFVEYLKRFKPNAKVAVLYLNTDMGQGFLAGLKAALAGTGVTLVGSQATTSNDPTVDTQLSNLRATGADTLMIATAPRQGAQAVRYAAESGWKPTILMSHASSSVANLKPAGLDNAKGVITAQFLKPFDQSKVASDPGLKSYSDTYDTFKPRFDKIDTLGQQGYLIGDALIHLLSTIKEPTRESLMRAARNLDGLSLGLLMPGIKVTTKSGVDGYPIESLQLFQFDGAEYQPIGEVISYEGKTKIPD
jgi:ABC-type branched-subunit amino acid transport system substrate-binding protein